MPPLTAPAPRQRAPLLQILILGVLLYGIHAWITRSETPPRPAPDGIPVDAGKIGAPALEMAPAPLFEAPVQLFVQADAEEIRVEILLALRALPGGAGSGGTIPVEAQPALHARAQVWAQALFALDVDGTPRPWTLERSAFVVRGPQGVLERGAPTEEFAESARLGLSMSAPRASGNTLALRLDGPTDTLRIPVTLLEEGASRTEELSPESPALVWTLPTPWDEGVRAVRRPTRVLALPVFALLLVVLALTVLARALRRRVPATRNVRLRVLLCGACLLAPYGLVPIRLRAADAPTGREAEAVVEALLANVYRALAVRDAEAAYDDLSISVGGALRDDIFLKQREALDLEGSGGARARVESVEVLGVEAPAPTDTGFAGTFTWAAAGSVVHFGHRHLRRNQYRARLRIEDADDIWTLVELEILEVTRDR
jgi:hypothetical protein